MDLSGEYVIPAPIETVWAGLNDPAILKACIPGCEELTRLSDTEMTAKVTQKIGPVSASFSGSVTLSDIQPPFSYRISGQGSGGVAGFAKGGASVALEKVEGGTRLTYNAEAAIGGKLAQLGSRMIKGVAASLANQFFNRFSEIVAEGGPRPIDPSAKMAGPAWRPAVSPPVASCAGVPGTSTMVGPSWKLFALAGWSTAAVLALIAILLTQKI